jgi:hypothetical protein
VARVFCGLFGILLLVPVDTSNYLTELANLIGLVGATAFAIWSWRSATTANAVASTTSN